MHGYFILDERLRDAKFTQPIELILSHLEAALLELHDGGVVDARALGEDQDRQLVGVLNVVPQSRRDQIRLSPRWFNGLSPSF